VLILYEISANSVLTVTSGLNDLQKGFNPVSNVDFLRPCDTKAQFIAISGLKTGISCRTAVQLTRSLKKASRMQMR
jgi:hypothetical protein